MTTSTPSDRGSIGTDGLLPQPHRPETSFGSLFFLLGLCFLLRVAFSFQSFLPVLPNILAVIRFRWFGERILVQPRTALEISPSLFI